MGRRGEVTTLLLVVLVVVVALAFSLVIGALAGIALSFTVVRWGILRRRREVSGVLSTQAAVIGLVPATTPPMTPSSLRRPILLSVFPGMLLGPFAVFLFVWLLQRGRSRRLVAFTDDGVTWTVATRKRSSRPIEVVASQPTTAWDDDRNWFRIYARVGDEELSVPRYGFTDQLPRG